MLYRLISVALLPLLAAAGPTFNIETIHGDAAPVISSANAEVISDSYIVVFKKHVTEAKAFDHHSWVQDIHMAAEGDRTELRKRSQFPLTTDIFEGIKHTYNVAGGFLGYSGHFDESVIERVRRHPDVSSQPATVFITILPVLARSQLPFLEPSLRSLYLVSTSATSWPEATRLRKPIGK